MSLDAASPSPSTPSGDSPAARFGSGHAVRRLEDEALLKGLGRYTDDVVADGEARLAFLRSPHPHARIVSIDTETARAMPGVIGVYTGADLVAAGVRPLAGNAGFKRADGTLAGAARRALAHERVRFVGEPVAVVVADTLQAARDAAEAVFVDYEALPMVVNVHDAMAPGAPALVPEAPDNVAAEMRHGDRTACDAAFAAARHVVKLSIANQRVAAVTIEPRSVLAEYDAASDQLTLRMSTQMPSGVKNSLCNDILGLPREKVRVLVGDVGGGFGMKTGIYPEDAVVAWCARATRRACKWVADRSEEFVATSHGRDVLQDAELALAEDGRVLGLRVASRANIGAYPTGTGIAIQLLIGPWVQTSVYDIPVIDFHFKAVMTNTAPTGAYRGAGRPEAIFLIERLMDEAARQTGIDRVALRRRNFVRPEQMPYKNPMNQVYDSGRFESVMDQGLALADWDGFAGRERASQAAGRWRGLGLATFLEWTGGNVFEERVTVTVTDGGTIEVFSAVNAMGQGIATTLAQLVVDAFGVPIERVKIVLGDTARGDGFGSAGSRSLFTGGSAVSVGAERTIDAGRALAAKEFEASVEDVRYARGVFSVAGTDLSIDLARLAARQGDRRIFVDSTSSVSGPTWPNGCHVCEVEVDPATGEVEVARYASVNDVGRVVNPMIVRGQLDGGAVQGLGQALTEGVVYDAESGQPLAGSFMDYAVPRADLVRAMFVTEMDESTPCLTNPLGVKGVGELGTIGATPVVINAIADALARNGHARLAPRLQMPVTAPRLWTLLQDEAR